MLLLNAFDKFCSVVSFGWSNSSACVTASRCARLVWISGLILSVLLYNAVFCLFPKPKVFVGSTTTCSLSHIIVFKYGNWNWKWPFQPLALVILKVDWPNRERFKAEWKDIWQSKASSGESVDLWLWVGCVDEQENSRWWIENLCYSFLLTASFSKCYVWDITFMKLLFLCTVCCTVFEIPTGTSV